MGINSTVENEYGNWSSNALEAWVQCSVKELCVNYWWRKRTKRKELFELSAQVTTKSPLYSWLKQSKREKNKEKVAESDILPSEHKWIPDLVSYVDFMTQFAGEPTGLVAVASGIASIMPPPPHPPPPRSRCQSTPVCLQTQFGIKKKKYQRGQANHGYKYYLFIVGNNKKSTKHEDLHFAVWSC